MNLCTNSMDDCQPTFCRAFGWKLFRAISAKSSFPGPFWCWDLKCFFSGDITISFVLSSCLSEILDGKKVSMVLSAFSVSLTFSIWI